MKVTFKKQSYILAPVVRCEISAAFCLICPIERSIVWGFPLLFGHKMQLEDVTLNFMNILMDSFSVVFYRQNNQGKNYCLINNGN